MNSAFSELLEKTTPKEDRNFFPDYSDLCGIVLYRQKS